MMEQPRKDYEKNRKIEQYKRKIVSNTDCGMIGYGKMI